MCEYTEKKCHLPLEKLSQTKCFTANQINSIAQSVAAKPVIPIIAQRRVRSLASSSDFSKSIRTLLPSSIAMRAFERILSSFRLEIVRAS